MAIHLGNVGGSGLGKTGSFDLDVRWRAAWESSKRNTKALEVMNEIKNILISSPPAFHYWRDSPQTGGFGKTDFEEFDGIISEYRARSGSQTNKLTMVETGAGLSTLWFLANEFHVVSFSLIDVIDKIERFLSGKFADERLRWTPMSGESERELVPFLRSRSSNCIDIALIDGNHSIPSVFADFVALNLGLKRNGFLIIDDLQLPGPFLLKQVLSQSPEWSSIFLSTSGKWECFSKDHDASIMSGNMKSFKIAPAVQSELVEVQALVEKLKSQNVSMRSERDMAFAERDHARRYPWKYLNSAIAYAKQKYFH